MSSEQELHKKQRDFFGSRFVGATISRVSMPGHIAERAIKWISNPTNFLVVTGPPGVGKTYFCASLLEYIVKKNFSYRAWNERKLFERLRQGISSGCGDYIGNLHEFADDVFLIVDDIGSAGYTDWREEVLMELVDFRYAERKPTVFTSNLSKDDFYQTYNARVASRIFSTENTILDFNGMPDQRELGN